MPDLVALNGRAANDAYRSGGYPEEQIVQVESLRYQYLASNNCQKYKPVSLANPLNLLILGDHLELNTQTQLRLLEDIKPSLPFDLSLIFKPHPARSLRAEDYPGLELQVVSQPIEELLTECHIAYTSSITSAAVDAYIYGMPIISILDGKCLNLSPLRGYSDVFFVSSAVQLIQALTSIMTAPPKSDTVQEFFTLHVDLPRWQKLLKDPESFSNHYN